MAKSAQPSQEIQLRGVISYFAFLLIVWGFYRLMFQFPEEIEETIIKPIVWLLPLFYLVLKIERKNLASLGITFKNLFPAIYMSFALGAVFAIEGILINFLKYGTLNFGANIGEKTLISAFLISLVTSVSEEISFRGYIFNRLADITKNEITATAISSIGWSVIHMPITFFVWQFSVSQAAVYLLLTLVFGIGSCFIFARTKNIFSSVLLHVLWQWPIILFR